MAEGVDLSGGWAKVLDRVSSPTDLGVLFTVIPVAFAAWFFFAPAIAASLPPATFGILLGLFLLGVKKLAIDRRNERAVTAELSPAERYHELCNVLHRDASNASRQGDDERERDLVKLLRNLVDQEDLVDSRLASPDAVNAMVDKALERRQKILGRNELET